MGRNFRLAPDGSWQVVVVENASGDGSGEKIAAAMRAEGWDAWARLLGFFAGHLTPA